MSLGLCCTVSVRTTGSTSHRSPETVLHRGHPCSTAISGSQDRRASSAACLGWSRVELAQLRLGLPLLTQEFATAQGSSLCVAGSLEESQEPDVLGLTSSRLPL